MMQQLSLPLLHRLRYFSQLCPVQEDAEKHKVMGGFYSEHQGHSLDTRDGFWGPCGPPKMECRIGSGCMLLGRVLQMSFSSYKCKQCMGLRLIMGQGDQEMTVGMEEVYMGEQVASPFPSLQTQLIFPSLLGNFT